MRFFVRAVQIGFVWLTAVTTLIAGVPHFDCVCPYVDHPFRLGTSSARSCCCGGSCCSSSTGGECTSRPTGLQVKVKSSGCQRTLSRSDLVGVAPAKERSK